MSPFCWIGAVGSKLLKLSLHRNQIKKLSPKTLRGIVFKGYKTMNYKLIWEKIPLKLFKVVSHSTVKTKTIGTKFGQRQQVIYWWYVTTQYTNRVSLCLLNQQNFCLILTHSVSEVFKFPRDKIKLMTIPYQSITCCPCRKYKEILSFISLCPRDLVHFLYSVNIKTS